MRGDNGNESDNKQILYRLATLRAERSRLLGYATYADLVLEDRMAKTPARVYALLNQLWTPALAVAQDEAHALQEMIARQGQDFKLEAWDWRYYAEKLRQQRCRFDEATVKPYLSLEQMIEEETRAA